MEKYRCAIIGCGPRGREHAEAYRFTERGKLIAVCDLDTARRQACSEAYHVPAYADVHEMLDTIKPDLVHLVMGSQTRVPLMTMISEHRIPACIVEKPIACGVTDWKQLCDLQAQSKTKFAVCHQMRWHKNVTHCRHVLESGELGKLLFLDFSARMNISAQGTHMLDHAMNLNGDWPVTEVFGAISGTEEMKSTHPGPDTIVAKVTFDNGVRGLWNIGVTAPAAGKPEIIWQHCRIAAFAERGRVLWEEFGKWESVSPNHSETGFQKIEEWPADNARAMSGLINAMFDWIEEDARIAATHLKRGLHQWKAVLALYASSIWQKPIKLTEFDPPDDLLEQMAG